MMDNFAIVNKLKEELTDGIKKQIDNLTSNINYYSDYKKSTRGENSKQYDLYDHRSNLESIIDGTAMMVKKLLKDRKIDVPLDNLKFFNAWSVYGQKGSYHLLHRHKNHKNNSNDPIKATGLSIVIYLAVPEKDIENPGQFYFILHDKNGVKPHQITPEKGTIIIVPNNVWHGAEPQGEGLRQTLNLEYTW